MQPFYDVKSNMYENFCFLEDHGIRMNLFAVEHEVKCFFELLAQIFFNTTGTGMKKGVQRRMDV